MQSECLHMIKPIHNWTNNCSGQLTGSTLCSAKASVLRDLSGLLSISPHCRFPSHRCLGSKVSTTEWSLRQALTGPVATGQNDTCADVINTTTNNDINMYPHSSFSSAFSCHPICRLSLYPTPIHPSHTTLPSQVSSALLALLKHLIIKTPAANIVTRDLELRLSGHGAQQ